MCGRPYGVPTRESKTGCRLEANVEGARVIERDEVIVVIADAQTDFV